MQNKLFDKLNDNNYRSHSRIMVFENRVPLYTFFSFSSPLCVTHSKTSNSARLHFWHYNPFLSFFWFLDVSKAETTTYFFPKNRGREKIAQDSKRKLNYAFAQWYQRRQSFIACIYFDVNISDTHVVYLLIGPRPESLIVRFYSVLGLIGIHRMSSLRCRRSGGMKMHEMKIGRRREIVWCTLRSSRNIEASRSPQIWEVFSSEGLFAILKDRVYKIRNMLYSQKHVHAYQ